MERTSARRRALGTLTAALILGLAACSGASTPSRGRVQAALVTSGIPRVEAQCATKQLFTVLSKNQLRNLAERGSGALDDKTATALSTALATCVPSVGSGTTLPVAPSGSATTTPQTAPSKP